MREVHTNLYLLQYWRYYAILARDDASVEALRYGVQSLPVPGGGASATYESPLYGDIWVVLVKENLWKC